MSSPRLSRLGLNSGKASSHGGANENASHQRTSRSWRSAHLSHDGFRPICNRATHSTHLLACGIKVSATVDLAPSAWFLPSPICMRGGAAQDFASVRHFHRGIHLESTLVEKVPKIDSISKTCEITTLARWILFSEAKEPSFWKPPATESTGRSDLTCCKSAALIERSTWVGKVTHPTLIIQINRFR